MGLNTIDRQIRIFISSTFRDMNEERDYLITKVFPRLQAEAAKRDVSVVPVDLENHGDRTFYTQYFYRLHTGNWSVWQV